tara:strand:+ start:440 stop:655 length:216 start_codon:yes stop_codon:yes gene_type:complete
MKMYYVANVRFTDDSRKGAKQFTKEFLVEAVSITDAETTLTRALTEEGTVLDYEVRGIRASRIEEVYAKPE